jgi:hypothetical protein
LPHLVACLAFLPVAAGIAAGRLEIGGDGAG